MEFSVIIPTHNRSKELLLTLTGLARQSLSASSYEVIVVDDGSTDSTADQVSRIQQSYPVHLHYFYQENNKQGAARNLGARNAAGELLLFLGDDIEPSPEFLSQHLKHHRKSYSGNPENSKVAVLGYTTWPRHFKKTPFLEFIGEHGWQFGYSLIKDPENVPFNFFYTSNISLSRKLFIESGGFDEDFREYGWEDIELSVRLKNAGMRIVYNPRAVAYHHHPTTISTFIKRQRRVGLSAVPFLEKHPELRDFLGIDNHPDYTLADHLKMRFLRLICQLTEQWRWPDFSRFYPDLMTFYYLQGLAEGKRRLVLSADMRDSSFRIESTQG